MEAGRPAEPATDLLAARKGGCGRVDRDVCVAHEKRVPTA